MAACPDPTDAPPPYTPSVLPEPVQYTVVPIRPLNDSDEPLPSYDAVQRRKRTRDACKMSFVVIVVIGAVILYGVWPYS